mmetsp:Transcript_20905/g.45514  ORF Transcript_20905/g.45514 Transcript_20905/m.45514 type:complete len:278 (-) Transcript_20905:888-1721(-)
MLSIFSLIVVSSSYKNLKLDTSFSLQALTTVLARSAAPVPPWAQWSDKTASKAPAAMAASLTALISASVSVLNLFTATTTLTPNFLAFSMCFAKLAHPFSNNSTFSSVYSFWRGLPADTGGPPPCIFRARIVATITAALGFNPLYRHLILKNFSIPMSAPKPASVTQNPSGPTSLRAISSATTDEFPVAMLANGPAWTSTGVRSTVCISVGMMASFINTVRAPPQPKSSAVTGSPFRENPTTIAPSFSRKSLRDFARARAAITSEATVISKPDFRLC